MLGHHTVFPTSPLIGAAPDYSLRRRGYCGEVKIGEKMKYAIIEDGGKQYRAVEGQTIDVDLYPSDSNDQIDLERVLLISDDGNVLVGTPTIPGARVQATVVSRVKGPKVVVFRYKPKKRVRVKTGHRQHYTRLHIDSIVVDKE